MDCVVSLLDESTVLLLLPVLTGEDAAVFSGTMYSLVTVAVTVA